jgi:sigma-54 specific flagellar transcriptional regulator A
LQQFGWFNNLLDMKSLVEKLGDGWHGEEVMREDLPVGFQATPIDAVPSLFNSADQDDSPQAELDFAALSDCWGFNDSWAPTGHDVIEVDNFNLDENKGLKTYLQDIEVALIHAALKRCDENVSRAAKLLKLNRTTLVEKIKKYAISA